jgi:hypothetical protein
MDTPTVTHNLLTDAWNRQSIWSQTADRLKRRITRSRLVALALTVAGAVFATASSQLAGSQAALSRTFAFIAAVAIALVPVVRIGSTRQVVEQWTRARSVSEALKADVYRYLAGTSPFRGSDRDGLLAARSAEYERAAHDMVMHAEGATARQRTLPAVHDVASYLEHRISRQITGYYRPNARQMLRGLSRLRAAETVLVIVAALLSAAAATFAVDQLTAWTGVATTVAAAVAAHMAAGRYELQYVEFTRTASILEQLRAGFAARDVNGPATGGGDHDSRRQEDEFVDSAELAISIQNEAWMAQMPMAQSN